MKSNESYFVLVKSICFQAFLSQFKCYRFDKLIHFNTQMFLLKIHLWSYLSYLITHFNQITSLDGLKSFVRTVCSLVS